MTLSPGGQRYSNVAGELILIPLKVKVRLTAVSAGDDSGDPVCWVVKAGVVGLPSATGLH